MSDDDDPELPEAGFDPNAEMVQTSHLVPEDVKEVAQNRCRHGDMSDLVRRAYIVMATTGEITETFDLECEKKLIENQREQVKHHLTVLEEQLDELDEHLEQINMALESARESENQRETILADLEELLDSGQSVFPAHARVRDAASVSALSADEIVELLKERNPDVPDAQFEDRYQRDTETDAPRRI